jgi:cyclophilin family peptidyl-prolyl cis-trans isomerase
MRRSIRGVWDRLQNRKPAPRGNSHARSVRPRLESLEDRLTPTTQVFANGVLTGLVTAPGGTVGLPGIGVTLTGTTTTGRTIDVNATTNAAGQYTFTDMLPGTYSVTRGGTPDFFTTGGQTLLSNIVIPQGGVSNGNNLSVGGLNASHVSLALFLSGPSAAHTSLPAGGGGTAAAFTLDLAGNPISNTGVAKGATSFVDLASNFFDPDTTNTTVTFNTTLGTFNVNLLDTSAPETVTNFLNYIQAGDYNNGLFHRLSNLAQTTAMNPVLTPNQVLQAGGFQVTTDTSTPANVTAITTTPGFQPISNEFSAANPNVAGTLAMARGSSPNSATSQFFFNLSDNSSALGGSNGGGFAVFGSIDPTKLSLLQGLIQNTTYTPTDVSTATSNTALVTVPLKNGFTPANNFPTGATVNDLLVINSVTVPTAPTGHLSYSILSNSNQSVATVTLGANTTTSNFSANQLKIVAGQAGSTVITLQIQDNRGETVTKQFTITVV